MGKVSDGYHTFNELYYYRMLYNAAFFNLLPKEWVHKSKRHHTGEECFGGGWFIVMVNLPTGQVSNHYELKDWDLFKVPEKEFADEWDGHTSQEAAKRIYEYLQQEQPEVKLNEETLREEFHTIDRRCFNEGIEGWQREKLIARHFYELGLNTGKVWNGGDISLMKDCLRDVDCFQPASLVPHIATEKSCTKKNSSAMIERKKQRKLSSE